MGIHDRDYMKRRRTDADDESSSDSEQSLDRLSEGFLTRYPSLPKIVLTILAILIILALVFTRR